MKGLFQINFDYSKCESINWKPLLTSSSIGLKSLNEFYWDKHSSAYANVVRKNFRTVAL